SQAFDLSYAAFQALADPGQMRLKVRYEVVSGPEAAASPATSPTAAPPANPTQAPALPPPAPTALAEATPVTVEAAAAAQPEPIPAGGRYVVQPGETLFSIARRFGLSAAELAAWNGLADPDLLAQGQEITLVAPAAPAPTAAPAP